MVIGFWQVNKMIITKNSKISYRQDIDGLRAIAVLSVLFFHLNNSFLSGGFVGVDIFFVISGFLITKILIKDIEKDNFSFSFFYIKRIRRIFPALFVVLLACLIMATLTLTAEDFKWFGKTLKYTSLQISNILFQKQVGYFDPAFEGMPLLHTWSLGVEEQFYLIWPVMLLLLFKFKKCKNIPFYGLITISIISLALSQYLVSSDHQRIAFFSLPSRLWELGLGGILAFDKIKQPQNRKINELLGILGIALIAASLFIVKNNSFPGLIALLPCLGAGLVIFSGNKEKTTITAKILSGKILVFIGLISYSLYLWHWPIIVFYKEYSGEANLSLMVGLVISSIAIFISYLSWRFIENPFRKRKELKDESSFYLIIGRAKNAAKQLKFNLYNPIIVASILIISFSVISKNIKKTGWEWRMSEQGDISLDTLNSTSESDCIMEWDKGFLVFNKCVIGNNKKKPEIFLFGDSHAEHYVTAVIDWAKKRNLTVLLLSSSGCPPIFDIKIETRPSCIDAQRRIRDEFEKNRSNIDYVFVAARWSLYVKGVMPEFLLNDINSKDKKSSIKNAERVFDLNLAKTLKIIGDKKIILLGEVPSSPDNRFVEQAKKKNRLFIYKKFPHYSNSERKIYDISTREDYRSKVQYIDKILRGASAINSNIKFFDPTDYFCDDKFCLYQRNNSKLLYKDDNHLNINGGHYIGEYFDF